jgi:hypothetical protein
MKLNRVSTFSGKGHSIISRCSSKNERIPILRNKSIGLIKWGKGRIGELTHKHPASKEELARGPLGNICRVSVEIFSTS